MNINKCMAKKRFKQGQFTPKNKEKYLGDVEKIIYRSGWELQYCKYCDTNPSIIKWNSEDVIIPYFNPMDEKVHRYHIDFYIKYKAKNGDIKQALIEIKPHAETLQPNSNRRKTKRYLTEVTTYIRNQAKWEHAKVFAEKHGCSFEVITEKRMPSLLK